MKKNLERSSQFTDLLTVRLAWSKNIHEEQDCPKQMVLGSSDPRYCVLLNLAVFLEKWLRDWTGTTSRWLFTDGTTNQTSSEESQEKETERYKVLYAKTLKNILEDNSFFEKSPLAGELRTRSIQKYSATIARKSGVSKDNLDYQARWKSKRMQDNYVGMELSWPGFSQREKSTRQQGKQCTRERAAN